MSSLPSTADGAQATDGNLLTPSGRRRKGTKGGNEPAPEPAVKPDDSATAEAASSADGEVKTLASQPIASKTAEPRSDRIKERNQEQKGNSEIQPRRTDAPEGSVPADLTFQQARTALDLLIAELQSNDLQVEEMLSLYRRAEAYAAHCEAVLQKVDQDVIEWDVLQEARETAT